MPREDMTKNHMMAHLTDALGGGQDIGHYGRLVYTIVGRHFVEEDELVSLLAQDKDFSEEQARDLVRQGALLLTCSHSAPPGNMSAPTMPNSCTRPWLSSPKMTVQRDRSPRSKVAVRV